MNQHEQDELLMKIGQGVERIEERCLACHGDVSDLQRTCYDEPHGLKPRVLALELRNEQARDRWGFWRTVMVSSLGGSR